MHWCWLALWLIGTPAEVPPTNESNVIAAPIIYAGDVPEAWQRQFAKRLALGLGGGRLGVDPSIIWTVQTTVERRDGEYYVKLTVSRSDGDTAATEAEDRCELCGEGEVAERLELVAARLRRQLEATVGVRPRLLVRSRPSGALVEIDGEVVGRTPLDVSVDEGPHVVEVKADGHAPGSFEVSSVAGSTTTRELVLVADETSKPKTPLLAPGIALTAVGVAGIVTGAVLLTLHGREVRSRCRPDVDGDCMQLFNTRLPGAVVVGVGGALGITGAVLWGHSRRSGRRRQRK